MTQFYEVTPEHGKVFYNGLQIGIYKNFKWSKQISLEIGYTEQTVDYKDKHIVKRLAERIHLRQVDRTKRELTKKHKLRNSIYNTGQEYTIK